MVHHRTHQKKEVRDPFLLADSGRFRSGGWSQWEINCCWCWGNGQGPALQEHPAGSAWMGVFWGCPAGSPGMGLGGVQLAAPGWGCPWEVTSRQPRDGGVHGGVQLAGPGWDRGAQPAASGWGWGCPAGSPGTGLGAEPSTALASPVWKTSDFVVVLLCPATSPSLPHDAGHTAWVGGGSYHP